MPVSARWLLLGLKSKFIVSVCSLWTGRTKPLLEETLKQRGWTLGQNLKIEYRIYNGDTDLAHRYARELISLKPDVCMP